MAVEVVVVVVLERGQVQRAQEKQSGKEGLAVLNTTTCFALHSPDATLARKSITTRVRKSSSKEGKVHAMRTTRRVPQIRVEATALYATDRLEELASAGCALIVRGGGYLYAYCKLTIDSAYRHFSST